MPLRLWQPRPVDADLILSARLGTSRAKDRASARGNLFDLLAGALRSCPRFRTPSATHLRLVAILATAPKASVADLPPNES